MVVSFTIKEPVYTSLRVLCANIPLPLKLTDPLVTFFSSVFGTNFLSPTSQIFLVALAGFSVTSSNDMTSAGSDRLNVTVPEYV